MSGEALDNAIDASLFPLRDGYEALPQAKGYAARIQELVEREADPEEYFVPPTAEAALEMLRLLASLQSTLPMSGLSNDGFGGLEAYWMEPVRHVQLNVPHRPAAGVTIFWDDESDCGVERLVDVSQLDTWLAWVQRDERSE